MRPKPKSPPPKRAKGTAAPTNDAIQALQAESIFKMRVEGKTMEEVARHHNMGIATAYRRMKWAEEQGIVLELQERVRRDLAPKALKAYEGVLDRTTPYSPEELETQKLKLTAAKDISFGSGILTKDTQKAKHDVEEFSLAWLHQQRQLKNGHPEGSPEVVDAVLEPGTLPEGASAHFLGDGEDRPETSDVDRELGDRAADDRGEEE